MVSMRALGLGGLAAALLVGCFGQIDTTGSTQSRALPQGGDPPSSSGAPAPDGGSASAETPFLTLGYPPDTLVNDADYLYWSELNSVFRASKVAPVREKLFGDGTATTGSLAVDDGFVYAVDWQRGTLLAQPKGGGAIETVLPDGAGARVIAQDDTSIYVGMSNKGGIRVFAKSTHASVATLRAGQSIMQLTVSGGFVFSVEGDYVTRDQPFRIVRTGKTEGAAGEVLSTISSAPYRIVAWNDEVYWTDDHGLISTSSLTPLYLATAGTFVASAFSVIGDSAYVTEMQSAADRDGTLVRVPLDGGASSIVATLALDAPPRALRAFGIRQTSDAANIYVSAYWTNPMTSARGDAILRVPIP